MGECWAPVLLLRTTGTRDNRGARRATHRDRLLNHEIPLGPQPGIVRLVQGCHIRTHILLREDDSILSSPLLRRAEEKPCSVGLRVSHAPTKP